MSKRIDTMATAAPQGADTLKLTNFAENFLNYALLVRIFYPITVASVAFPNPAATARQIMAAALQSWSLRYGAAGDQIIYPTVPGAEVRNVSRYATRLECPNNLAAITWDVLGNYTARVDFAIPFALETQSDGKARLPGWVLTKSMVIDIVEGAALSINAGRVVRGAGNVLFDIDTITVPSALDQAGPVLSYFRANQASLIAEGPAGMLAGAWEISNPQATTPITLFSLKVGGIQQEDVIPPYIAGDKYQMFYDTGISPITDEVNMAFSPLESEPGKEFPTGAVVYQLAAQDIAQIQLRGLMWPFESLQMAQDNAQESSKAGPVLAKKSDEALGMSEAAGATLPAIMHTPGTAPFTLGHGLLAPGGGAKPYFQVPEFKGIVAGSAVDMSATQGAATMAAQQSSQLQSLVKTTPGLSSVVMQPNKPAAVDAQKYLKALDVAAGDKGAASVRSFAKSIKI